MTNKQPVKKIKVDNITASIWENESVSGNMFYSTTIEKYYKNGDGKWQSTSRFSQGDLVIITALALKCVDWMFKDADKDEEEETEE